MTDRYLPLLTTAPLAAYGVAAALSVASGWSAVVVLVALLTALPVLAVRWPGALFPLALPAVVLGVGLVVDSFLTGQLPTGAAADAAVGILLGAPFWTIGLIAGVADRPGLGLAALGELLVQSLLLRVASSDLPGPVSAPAFLNAWLQVWNRQTTAEAAAITNGGLGVPVQFATGAIPDAIFVGAAILALAGILFPLLPPLRSARLPPVPVPRRHLAPPVRLVPPPVLNPPDTAPTPPRPSPGPGLTPVIGALLAVASYELVAAAVPRYAFLAVTLAVVASCGAIAFLGRYGVPRGAIVRSAR